MLDSVIPPELLKLPDQVENKSTESRLASASDARSLLTQALREDQVRSYQRAIVKGCYDGNAPYNQRVLNEQGRGWECNLNWMGLEGIVDSSRIPYYALFSGVPTYATFRTKYKADEPDADLWNTIIADKFTCLLNRWKKFKWVMQASQFEMLFEGWGPVVWERPEDWRFQAIPAKSVLVPQESESVLSDKIPWVIVLCSYRVHELYDFIRDEEAAKARGWDVEAVKQAILNGTKGYDGNGSITWRDQPWEKWQQMYKNKELYASFTDCDIVCCAQIFLKEYSGKISQFIFSQSEIFDNEDQDAKGKFLFADLNRFKSYSECMNVAFQNTGDGTWHSVRGVGLKSFKHEEVGNRLKCRAINNGFLSTSIVLQSAGENTRQKLQLMINGMVTALPAGATYVDRRIAGDIEGVLALSRFLDNNLAQKIGHFQQRSIGRDDGRGEMPTAKHVELQASKEGSLSNAQIDNYYLELDSIYDETYRRVKTSSDPEAKRFRQDCIDAGVPEQALQEMEYVRANRLSGYGSPQMRKMAMQESMPLVPMLNEEGKNAWLNEAIATVGGADKVRIWNPPMQKTNRDMWDAQMENDSMQNGVVPFIVSGQNNVIHLQTHLQFAENKLAPLQEAIESGQQVDPSVLQEAFEYASILGPHCEEHLAKIENDNSRSGLAQMFKSKLNLIFSFHGKLRSAIRKAQAEAAQAAKEQEVATAIGLKTQMELQAAQQKMQIEAAEAQQGMAIKASKAQQQNALKRWQVGQKAQLDTITTAETIRLDRIKTAADVSQKKLNAPKGNGSKGK